MLSRGQSGFLKSNKVKTTLAIHNPFDTLDKLLDFHSHFLCNAPEENGKCILTGNPSTKRVLFAKAY